MKSNDQGKTFLGLNCLPFVGSLFLETNVMGMEFYILNDKGEPVLESDLIKWGEWFGEPKSLELRFVEREEVGDSKVSTVFLGLDHGFRSKIPILWETMVFGGELNYTMWRCGGSREQAEAMHARAVMHVKERQRAAMEKAAGYANAKK